MNIIRKIDNYLEEVILIILLICMVIIMGLQIFSRYCLHTPLSWSEELTLYLFVWSVFLSISYCVKKRISIKIEQFLMILPPRGQTGLRLLRHTLVFIFCLIMIPYAWTFVQQSISFGATSPALHLPMVFIQSAPLVGFVLLLIRVAQAWVREARNLAKKGGEEA